MTANVAPASIGDLRERVVIQQRADSVDATGDVTYAWSNLTTVWAQVEPTNGATRNIADRRAADQMYDIVIRYISGMSGTYRVLWRGKYFQIESIKNIDMRKRYLLLTCHDLEPDAGLQQ